MNRVLNSSNKQKALVQLMSSDPALLNGLDDNLLTSITLLSDPLTKKKSILLTHVEKTTIQLYQEDAAFAEKKTSAQLVDNLNGTSRSRANVVLLSPSSNAKAVAATAHSKQEDRKSLKVLTSDGKETAHVPRRRTIRCERPRPPMVLLDDGMLVLVDRRRRPQRDFSEGSVRNKGKRMIRLDQKIVVTSSSSSNISADNSENENNQHESTAIRLVSSFMTDDRTSDSDERTLTSSSYDTGDSRLTPRLKPHHFISQDELVPQRACKACYICVRKFNMLRKRHSCKMCGEVVCSRCSVLRLVGMPMLGNKLRICSCCFVACRKKFDERREDEADNTDPGSDSSADHQESAATRGGSSSAENTGYSASDMKPSLPPSEISFGQSPLRNIVDTTSDYSFSSDALFDVQNSSSGRFSGPRSTEELKAALKAKQLEKEVKASQQRIQTLEAQIQTQESQQDLLSTEQQTQLQDARATIKLLQEQLRMQEVDAKRAAHNRDSICLSNLRQTESHTNVDDESQALKRKLKVLERQLQQAGISVAEVIPYEMAKKKVMEISKKLQKIGFSEVVLTDKQAQAAARKEYYILEQEMEKYHMALVTTDEYIEEQRRQEQEWEDANRAANLEALLFLRSAIPVDISRLSERDLAELVTPTGTKFPPELARRLKRTNVLQLLRTDPKTVVKMHPGVIEGYRTTGLTVLERRALHAFMQGPFEEWKKQQSDEMGQKKYAWYCNLKETFVTAATNLQTHCASCTIIGSELTEIGDELVSKRHSCTLLGLACPVRAEERIRKLYCGLGFTADAVFIKEDIVKSDPEGAGEKALLEAQAHGRQLDINQRQRDVNMRGAVQAVGALEDMNSLLQQIRVLDEALAASVRDGTFERQLSQCNSLLDNAYKLMLLLGKRAGICVTGTRNLLNDQEDTRSAVEICEAGRAMVFMQEILADVRMLLHENKCASSTATYKAVESLLNDVRQKNRTVQNKSRTSSQGLTHRVSWMRKDDKATNQRRFLDGSSPRMSGDLPCSLLNRPAISTLLFDAIKARRKQNEKRTNTNEGQAKENKMAISTLQLPSKQRLDSMAAMPNSARVEDSGTS